MVNITVPSQLASLALGTRSLQVEAATLGEVFLALDKLAPMMRSQIFDSTGSVRQFIGLFLNDRQVFELGDGGLETGAGSRIAVVMAVAGG